MTEDEDDAFTQALTKAIRRVVADAAEGKPMDITNLTIPLFSTAAWVISQLPPSQQDACIKQSQWLLADCIRLMTAELRADSE